MRRVLAVLGAAVVALLLVAPVARADESIPGGSWEGSALDAGPGSVATGSYRLSGAFRRRAFDNRRVEVTVAATPARLGPCAINPVVLPWATTPTAFDVTLSIPCNGTYTVSATAQTTDDNALRGHESAVLDRPVKVAAPAPTVTGVDATADGRTVTVTWDDMRGAAPDLAAYVVERKVGDAAFDELAVVDAGTLTYEDAALPASGGEASYRLRSVRPSPDGDKVSAASDADATEFAAAPTGDAGAGGDTGDSGSTGGAGSDGGAGASAAGGSGSANPDATGSAGSSASGSRARVKPPRVFSGTFLPPLLRPIARPAAPTTSTTVDGGFDEALPYEQRPADPVESGGAMASIFTDGAPGKGMVIPVATALVLAVWAFHLRVLARAARPVR
jgi:hypothetical protein